MIRYRLRSQRKKAAEEQAQKNPVNDPDRLRKIRRASAQKAEEQIYISLCGCLVKSAEIRRAKTKSKNIEKSS